MGDNLCKLFAEGFLALINHELKLRMQRGERANMVVFMTSRVYRLLNAMAMQLVSFESGSDAVTVCGCEIRLVYGDDFSYWVGYEVFAGVTVPEEEEQHGAQ